MTHIAPAERKPILHELKGGLAYARSEPAIIALTVLASMTTFLGLPLLTFLPMFARDIFHGDIGRYSEMMAFSGVGAVVRRAGGGVARTLPAHGADAAAGADGVRRADRRLRLLAHLLAEQPAAVLRGAALLMVFSMTASLVQLIVPDHLRGRVVSIYMVAFRGGMPLGSLAGGYAASLTSVPVVLADQRRAGLAGGDVFFLQESWGAGVVNPLRRSGLSVSGF